MEREHIYKVNLKWTGNNGSGTSDYRTYERSHVINSDLKAEILASSDPAFRGDKTKYNPEELLVASLSSCHMLWFFHLCADSGVVVTEYTDDPEGIMIEDGNKGGKFKEVTLQPIVTVVDRNMIEKVEEIHKKAHALCFVANSVNFPVFHKPVCKVMGS
jgi:organic hydroperoxide reductase OsmC/OhrA